MSKFTLAGFLFCGGGVVMAIFQGIQSMMTAGKIEWVPLALVDVMDEARFTWIDNLSSAFLRNTFDTVVTLPLFGILIGIGVLALVIGGLVKK